MSHRPVVLVHGGAGMIASAQRRRACGDVVRTVLRGARLEADANAAVLVTEAVDALESSGRLNAGRGAVKDAQGGVSLDAGFMDGSSLRFGSVGAVRRTRSPILLARRLSKQGPYGLFVAGRDADEWSRRLHLPLLEGNAGRASRDDEVSGADTVGAVALDTRGRVAAAVSTGGLHGKPVGRIGDSAIVGAGFWAERRLGAAVTTGVGEAMMREGTARRCVRLLAEGFSCEQAVETALAELSSSRKESPPCGIILISVRGEIAIGHTSRHMPAGFRFRGGRTTVRDRW